MAITYTWKIDMIHTGTRGPIEDMVTEVHWSKTGVDDNGIGGRFPHMTRYTQSHAQAAIDAGTFTPFNALTEEQVLDWVRSTLSQEDEDFINMQITSEISAQINRPKNSSVGEGSFPWSNGD
jgi:hypothetical protein